MRSIMVIIILSVSAGALPLAANAHGCIKVPRSAASPVTWRVTTRWREPQSVAPSGIIARR